MAEAPAHSSAPEGGLRRHIPELAIEWALESPGELWRQFEGTLCFADISGFTALAERLAQRGRMGGEELVETLGRVFSEMLDIADGRGGSLLKFGGDALLLFFRGDDHAMQAASAAVEMRAALREAAKIKTSVGPLRLSMSVGLHSGPVDCFLAGGAHRELVLLGPAADKVVDTENAANAREIALSDTTASLLPKGATKLQDDGKLLLRWRKPPVAASDHREHAACSTEVIEALFPRELGRHLTPGAPDPEHRIACIAFIRCSGTDAVLTDQGPRQLAQALQATLAGAQKILEEEGVTLLAVDIDKDGFKLFLGAGVPQAREDDEGVMLRAARRIVDAHLPLQLQIGVNRGHVFAAEVGSRRRAAYSAMGDTTNTAARLCAKAPIGHIYAHPSVLDESLTTFVVQPTEPLTMKGKKIPLVVYDVGQRTGVRTREGLAVQQFIGRKEELAALLERVAGLRRGTGSALCIVGESGLGKTRLIEEALRHFGRPPALEIRPEPYAASRQFRAFRDQMRNLLEIQTAAQAVMRGALLERLTDIDPNLVPYAALIADVLHIDLDPSAEVLAIQPQFRPARLATAVVQILAKLCPGPQTFAMDDAHWCDEASAQLMAAIAEACDDHPWLVVAARRDLPGGFSLDDRLVLDPMATLDMEELVRIATEAAPLRPHELQLILERSSGNPLFATEIIQAARDAGSFDSLPLSLEAALITRVDGLDAPARRLLRYASVLGRSFPVSMLEQLMAADGEAFDAGTLTRLEDFLEGFGDRYRFRNGVVRDSVYEAMSFRLRTHLHRIAAEVIEQSAEDPAAVASSLAVHLARGGKHQGAWKYSLMAAEEAREAYANADAARLYAMALEAARKVPGTNSAALVGLWTELGEVRDRAGLFEDSMEAFSNAYRLLADDPVAKADLLIRKARSKDRTGAFSSSLRDLTRARKLLDPLNTNQANATLADVMAQTAYILWGLDRPRKASAQASEAADLARRAGALDPLGHALIVMDLCDVALGSASDGARLLEALEIFRKLDDPLMQALVKSNLGFVCAHAGRWDEGLRLLQESRELSSQIGDTVGASWTALNLSEMLMKQRRFLAAQQVLEEVIRDQRAVQFDEGVHRAELQLGRILIEIGEQERADEMLARVAQAFYETGQPLTALETLINRAYGLRRQGRHGAAIELLDDAVAAAGPEVETLLPGVACERAPALAAVGRIKDAEMEIEKALRIAEDSDLPYERAMLLLAREEVNRAATRPPDTVSEQAARKLLRGFGVVDA